MTDGWTSPSGSRWEPVPQQDPTLDAAATSGPEPAAERRRPRRGPVLVALVALLSIGGVGAGALHEEYSRTTQGTAVGAPAGHRPHHGGHA